MFTEARSNKVVPGVRKTDDSIQKKVQEISI